MTIMYFYGPVSNTRCHSIGHRHKNSKNQNPGRQSMRDGKEPREGTLILKRCVLSLERNIGREDEFRVSGEGVNSRVVDR